jgi:hypothetical protein
VRIRFGRQVDVRADDVEEAERVAGGEGGSFLARDDIVGR